MLANRRAWLPAAWVSLALFGFPLAGQELPAIKLRPRETIPVEGQVSSSYMVRLPLKCDARGNVYLRWYRQEVLQAPVVRISEDGKKTTEFSLASAPGFERNQLFDFAVAPAGDVYLLGAKDVEERHVVRFREDGEFDSMFTLEPLVDPEHLVVFPSGELLVSGLELSASDRKRTGRLLLALYDRRGRFLQEISLPRDIQVTSETEQGPSGGLDSEPAQTAYAMTNLVTAQDGNAYLMRPATPPAVYVISPTGAVLRRFLFSPPSDDFQTGTMKVSPGRIVIQFMRQRAERSSQLEVFSVFDLHSGERIADYASSPETGGAWACYTDNQFTFLGSGGSPRRMALIHASPE